MGRLRFQRARQCIGPTRARIDPRAKKRHLFRCEAVRDGRGPRPEPTEFIRVVEVPFGEAMRMASEGRISDAATVLGLLLAGGSTAAGGGLH